MTETKAPGEKKISVSGSKLTLKPRTETGVVRQSFSHGRSKQVVVEKVKRRIVGPGEAKPEPIVEAPKRAAAPAARGPAVQPRAPAAEAPKPSGVVLRTLTEEERAARAHALADSRVREAEERKHAEEEARRRAIQDAKERVEREAAEARKRDEEHRRKHDEESKRKADEVAKKRLGDGTAATTEAKRPGGPAARIALEADEDDAPRARRGAGGAARPAAAPRPAPKAGAEKQRGIGFGTEPPKCGTCCAACRARERDISRSRRTTAALPDKQFARSRPLTCAGSPGA